MGSEARPFATPLAALCPLPTHSLFIPRVSFAAGVSRRWSPYELRRVFPFEWIASIRSTLR
jgi:hypothetical protein